MPSPPPAPSSAVGLRLSEYEQQRLENMSRNAAFLSQIGMDAAKSDLAIVAQETKRKKAAARGIRAPAQRRAKLENAPRRKSSRLENKPAINMMEDPEELFNPAALKKAREIAIKEERLQNFGPEPISLESHNCTPESDTKLKQILKNEVATSSAHATAPSRNDPQYTQIKEYTKMVSGLKIVEEDVAKVVKDRATTIAFHPSSDKLMVGTADKFGRVGIWLVDHREEQVEGWNDGVFLFQPHNANVGKIQFHPSDFSKMYTTSYDGTVRCLDLNAGHFARFYAAGEGDAAPVSSCIPEGPAGGGVLYLADGGGGVACLDLRTGRRAWAHALGARKVNTVHANPAAPHYLATASLDRTVALWDARRLGPGSGGGGKANAVKPLATATNFSRAINCAYFSYTGKHLVTVSQDDKNQVFADPTLSSGGRLGGSAPTLQYRHNNNTGRWLTKFHALWDPKGPEVYLTGSMENSPRRVEVFSANAQSPLARLLNPDVVGSVQSLAIPHPTLNVVASVNSSGKIHIWR
ncbi:unnamed protein product [Heterosigma akashiwo]